MTFVNIHLIERLKIDLIYRRRRTRIVYTKCREEATKNGETSREGDSRIDLSARYTPA